MPIIGSFGAGSGKGFGLGGEAGPAFIIATGGTETISGDYKIHTFTSDGTFTVTNKGKPTGSTQLDYLVVAGGGGGGVAGNAGGGGGAGGFRESHSTPVSGCYTASPLATPTGITVAKTAYPITVGGGGANSCGGFSGSDSVFSTITSTGGGYGGNGGSGGGVTGYATLCKLPIPAGTGNTPPVNPPQGNPGGTMLGRFASAGGGGATQAGVNSSPGDNIQATPGGDGATTSISGSPASYAGGGGGSGYGPPSGACRGAGGLGGGGDGGGACRGTMAGAAGTANTGGGGGGGGYKGPIGCGTGGAGGSGIVIIRYKYK